MLEEISRFLAPHLPAFMRSPLLTEWFLRLTLVGFLLVSLSLLTRKSRILAAVAWLDQLVGEIELTEADRKLFTFLLSFALRLGGLFLILIALRLYSLLTTLGLSAGAIATILAFANKDSLGHLFAGIALQTRQQIRVGDLVRVAGVSGIVRGLGLSSCEIHDLDGAVHYVPNSKMLSEILTNVSQASQRRVEIRLFFPPETLLSETSHLALTSFLQEIQTSLQALSSSLHYGEINEKGVEVKIRWFFPPSEAASKESEIRKRLPAFLHASSLRLAWPGQTLSFSSPLPSSLPQT